jgi:PKD repeat protein
MLRNESCAVTVTGEDYETPAPNLTVELHVQDPRGKEQPGYIARGRWVSGSWEALFQPPPSAATGKFTLSARIGDADGGWSPWKDLPSTVEVGDNIPSAAFTCPESAVQGDPVRFDGSASFDMEDPANILTFGWSFGDGSDPGIGRLATHSFARTGAFRVTLTVTDRDGGTATAQRTVSVTERPASPVTGGGSAILLIAAIVVIVAVVATGAYLMMKKKKPTNVSMIQDGRMVSPAPGPRPAAGTGQGEGEHHQNMVHCRQTHAEQGRAAANAEASEAGPYHGPYSASEAGPSPGPYPMPGPGPDPLRPAEPEPGPGPYPEPDDDDED